MKLKFRNFPIGKIILCMDLTIAVITGVVYRDFNNTLYSVIAMVVSSMALDRVVYGSTDARAGACESVFNIPGCPALNHRQPARPRCDPAQGAGLL